MQYKIASFNVNGLRACVKKNLTEWMISNQYQIIGMQETKLQPSQIPEELQGDFPFASSYSSAVKKGYSGVNLFWEKSLTPLSIAKNLQIEKFDNEGRMIIAEFPEFILYNCYFPNGSRDHSRVDYKLEFSELIANHALEQKKKHNKPVVIMGDFNTSHTAIDLKNAKTNTKSTGFLPREREWMDSFIAKGFVDIFRKEHPEEEGHYTWWSYRNDCRSRNIGWRLDYFFVTEDLVKNVLHAKILPEVHGSDHCPVELLLEF